MTKPKEVAVQFYLPDKLSREMKATCGLQGVTMKDWLRGLVETELANNRKEKDR